MDTAEVVLAVLDPNDYAQQCHVASLTIVQAEVFPVARVARGSCRGVGGQHSWVVLGPDVYAKDAQIVDPTLWSYWLEAPGMREDKLWIGSARDGLHVPHGGRGTIWDWGRPADPIGKIVELTPSTPFSREAREFLEILGPLDQIGWMTLCDAPVEGWPAAEIIAAIADTRQLGEAVIPIDRLGMLTDRNPGGLYLPGGDPADGPETFVVRDEGDLRAVVGDLVRKGAFG